MTDWEAIQQNLEVAARAHRDGYESMAIGELIDAVTQLADQARPPVAVPSIPTDAVLANLPEHLEDRELPWAVAGYVLDDLERMAFGHVTHYPHNSDRKDAPWHAYVTTIGGGERLDEWHATAEAGLAAVEAFVRRVTEEDARARVPVLEPEPF